jgi:ferredoxin-NADP reductase
LLYRAGAEREVVFRAELEALARRRGARVHILPGHRRQLGNDPLSTASIPDLCEHDVYVCGPDGMTAAAALRGAGVPRRQIHTGCTGSTGSSARTGRAATSAGCSGARCGWLRPTPPRPASAGWPG